MKLNTVLSSARAFSREFQSTRSRISCSSDLILSLPPAPTDPAKGSRNDGEPWTIGPGAEDEEASSDKGLDGIEAGESMAAAEVAQPNDVLVPTNSDEEAKSWPPELSRDGVATASDATASNFAASDDSLAILCSLKEIYSEGFR